jgi:hypothetical protein
MKKDRFLNRPFCLAAELGFEPRQTESESVVLPLHNSAKHGQIITHRERFVKRKFYNQASGTAAKIAACTAARTACMRVHENGRCFDKVFHPEYPRDNKRRAEKNNYAPRPRLIISKTAEISAVRGRTLLNRNRNKGQYRQKTVK